MSLFAQRQKMDHALHPDHVWEDKPPLVEPQLGDMMDADYQDERAGGVGARASATRHITSHYETGAQDIDLDKVVHMSSDKQRYEALNELTQNRKGAFGDECGSTVLLAGSLLAGGEGGISTLIDSVEAFKKKSADGKLSDVDLREMKELDQLKKRIAKGEDLTAKDLQMVSGDVNQLMAVTNPDGSTGGLTDKQLSQLMATSPELRKMWKNKDLSYDSIDISGTGEGSHAVLGIGHGEDDKEHKGPHQAVYDPLHRTTRDHHAMNDLQEAQERLNDLTPMDPGYGEALVKVTMAGAKEKLSHQDAGQLITDAKEVQTYQNATYKAYEFDGDDKKGGIDFKRYTPTNMWAGMY
jgi:hypothetical protein